MEVKWKFLTKSNFDDFRSGIPAVQDVNIKTKTLKFQKDSSCIASKNPTKRKEKLDFLLQNYKTNLISDVVCELKSQPFSLSDYKLMNSRKSENKAKNFKILDVSKNSKNYKKEHFKWLFNQGKKHKLNRENHKIYKLISKENQTLNFEEYGKKEKTLSAGTFFASVEQDPNKKRLADILVEFYEWADKNFTLENNELDPEFLMNKFFFDKHDQFQRPIFKDKLKIDKDKTLSSLKNLKQRNESRENTELNLKSKKLTSKLLEGDGVKLFVDFYKAKRNGRTPFSYT
jgi:hypothetical protein